MSNQRSASQQVPKRSRRPSSPSSTNATVWDTALNSLYLEGRAILAFAEREKKGGLGASAMVSAVKLLSKRLDLGGKIILTGVGKSGRVAEKIAATLSSTGSLAVFLHPTDGLHGDLGVVRSKDVVVALSYTGSTEELIRLIPSLDALEVPIISICGRGASPLVEASTLWIEASVEREACPHNLAPTASTTLALAIGDALAMSLMKLRGFDSQGFARSHPGGTLGRKLNLRVGDLMKVGGAVGVVASTASMEEVILKSTQTGLGCVLVSDRSRRLLGLITDGDLRRALSQRDRFFRMKASEVMTEKPVVGTPELTLEFALDLMQNRKSQIKELPIVGRRGEWLGVLRLHDVISVLDARPGRQTLPLAGKSGGKRKNR